jgi:hypothetical protein
MSKSIKANDEDRKKVYRQMDQEHRNLVAMGMIVSGTGRKQVFRDRRDRRPKDARRSWENDQDQ